MNSYIYIKVTACNNIFVVMAYSLKVFLRKFRGQRVNMLRLSGGGGGGYQKDFQRVQNLCLDIMGLSRHTVESLAVRRHDSTRREFKCILDRETHSCHRFADKAPESNYHTRS